MSKIVVSGTTPVAIRRPKGSTVTFANQDAAAVIYLSAAYGELAPFPPASANVGGFQIAKGVAYVYQNFPGLVWARASGGALSDGGTDNLEVTP